MPREPIETPPVVVVDAENVRRSRWPNVSGNDLVAACAAWAARTGARAVVVFDGPAPAAADGEPAGAGCAVVGTSAESADDWIARHAAELAASGEPYWLVTSDRELRRRAGGAAERTIGGGSFLRDLTG